MSSRIGLLVLLSFASCVDAEAVGEQRAAIVAGTPSGPADDAVVAIVFKSGALRCSGTLITPRVVLTAAHCDIGPSNYWQFDVHVGADIRGEGKRIAVADAVVHPAFERATFANDLSLLTLSEEAPVTPRPLRTSAITDADVGSEVRVVGFGQTSATTDDSGTRRQGIAKLSTVNATDIVLSGGTAQPCAYDSGGPAFITVAGVEQLAGVTSRGDSACASYARETRVDAFADFIDGYLKSAGPGARQLGERCFYDAHCLTGSCLSATDEPRIRYCSRACVSDADCGAMKCVAFETGKRCEKPRPTDGAPGAGCSSDDDCVDAECRASGDGHGFCARACSPLNTACPNGLVCSLVDEIRYICAPAPPPESTDSGCSLGRMGEGSEGVAALLLIAGILGRRRARMLREWSR